MKRALLCAAALLLAAPAFTVQAQAPAAAVAPAHERLVALQGGQNFRDIGGYRTADGRMVRWGVIFRSAGLAHLAQADVAKLNTLGIKTIHDLRSIDERTKEPTVWTGPGAPTIVATDYKMDSLGLAKMFDGSPVTVEKAQSAFAASYPQILAMQKPQQRALFADLLKGDGGVVYHCSAGKDRTGVATALVLSALGVPRETILADYELSNRYFTGAASAAGAEARKDDPQMAAFAKLPPEVIKVFMGVDARYLQAVFDEIEAKYGSVEAYLDKELGVDAADIARLKTLYLV